jgi:hypothetical protein
MEISPERAILASLAFLVLLAAFLFLLLLVTHPSVTFLWKADFENIVIKGTKSTFCAFCGFKCLVV